MEMLDFGAVTFDWVSFFLDLILIGVPVGIVTYFVVWSSFRKKLAELEKRVGSLEKAGKSN
ncbi:hypothetical protein [Brevibacillus parabrevis]|uniref:Uncharacterized protein n=2 Tax=Brevibacillus parabrevis TaxID=54914 RepID=A0A4Y3PKN3_BREPA|nr:hypothetical protein [Brevibacillus parabrevis]GEB32536.1 hypothetical protein BPA01_21160 [Brevibacillus parabrevis]